MDFNEAREFNVPFQHKYGYIRDDNEARDDRLALTSAEPYANHLHLASDRQPCQHLITQLFPDRMLFLTSN